jgi:Abortive infection C-terminus
MSRKIPIPVIAVVSDVLATRYTHSRIDYFMEAANIQCTPPLGNKVDKTRAWLRFANDTSEDPLATLGKVITELMEVNSSGYASETNLDPEREKIVNVLAENGLAYLKGGYITSLGATPVTKTLQDIISAGDLAGLQKEFDRIYANVEADPEATVTASCALLESLFKTYIEAHKLELPSEQSIRPLWKVVRKDLNLDPAFVQDEDLKTILSGLAAIVEGTGSLRTHKGSAHGRGKTLYKVKPRHARLAAHAAFTLATFLVEAWNERKSGNP